MSRPDRLVVGALKGGTTAVHALLTRVRRAVHDSRVDSQVGDAPDPEVSGLTGPSGPDWLGPDGGGDPGRRRLPHQRRELPHDA